MAFDKDFFKRFGINISLAQAQEKFRNKVNNVLFKSKFLPVSGVNLADVAFTFCLVYGIRYESYYTFEKDYLGASLPFNEYFARLVCLIDCIAKNSEETAIGIYDFMDSFLKESPVALNIRLVKKGKTYQVYPEGSKLLDTELVDDPLSILHESKYQPIRVAFEKGLREFLEASKDEAKLKNSIRDMQLATDELAKIILNDKNVGLKQLLKNTNWSKTGLNDYYKKMFFEYNEMIDKLVKHKSATVIYEEEAESIIYLTGLFIRLTFRKLQPHK